jgi:dihydroorotate dehydrogenase (NAD+) catalytic subunit
MRLVYEASQAVKIPLIGLGGIESAEDAVEYLLAGATAVEVGSAHFADPRASERIVEGLEKLCKEDKVSEISALRGSLAAEKA